MTHNMISPSADTVEGYDGFRKGVAVSMLTSWSVIKVSGGDANEFLDKVATGNIEELYETSISYSLILDAGAKIISDVLIFNAGDDYLLVMNAETSDAVLAQLNANSGDFGDIEITNVSDAYTLIGVDGPYAWEVPKELIGLETIGLRLLTFQDFEFEGHECLLARLGFAGEYGYMFLAATEVGNGLVEKIKEVKGTAIIRDGNIPDVVRLEVRSFNSQRDIPNGEGPLEAGLHWMIDFRKEDFIGLSALQAQLDAGVSRKLVALNVPTTRDLVAADVEIDGTKVGYVVNAGYSPIAETGIAFAYLNDEVACVGVSVNLPQPNGDQAVAKIVSAPFLLAESNQVEMT
jgi:aminomethyltransferase